MGRETESQRCDNQWKKKRLCHTQTHKTEPCPNPPPLLLSLYFYSPMPSPPLSLRWIFSLSSSMSLSPSSLYCPEDAADVVSIDANTGIYHSSSSSLSTPLYTSSSSSDQTTIAGLFDAEPDHMPDPDYIRRCRDHSIDLTTRQDSINWILKVHAYYHFTPITAFLSVNYFDRFLSAHSIPVIAYQFVFFLSFLFVFREINVAFSGENSVF